MQRILLALSLFILTASPVLAHPAEPTKHGEVSTHHLEIVPRDVNGEFISYISVAFVEIVDAEGTAERVDFHPMWGGFWHYGANVNLKPGVYTFKFNLHPTTAMRDDTTMDRFLEEIEFEVVFDADQTLVGLQQIFEEEYEDVSVEVLIANGKQMYAVDADHGDTPMGHDMNNSNPAAQQAILVVASLFVGLVAGASLTFAYSKRR